MVLQLPMEVVIPAEFDDPPHHLWNSHQLSIDCLYRYSIPLLLPLFTALSSFTAWREFSRYMTSNHGQACSDALTSGEWPGHHIVSMPCLLI